MLRVSEFHDAWEVGAHVSCAQCDDVGVGGGDICRL